MPGICIFHLQKRKKWLLAFLPGLLFFFQTNIKAQSGVLQKNPATEIFTSHRKAASPNEILGIGGCFVENIGQYGKVMKGYEALGPIQFGYEGLDMPVLFTSRGIIHLQRKIVHAEGESKRKEEKERTGKKGERRMGRKRRR